MSQDNITFKQAKDKHGKTFNKPNAERKANGSLILTIAPLLVVGEAQ